MTISHDETLSAFLKLCQREKVDDVKQVIDCFCPEEINYVLSQTYKYASVELIKLFMENGGNYRHYEDDYIKEINDIEVIKYLKRLYLRDFGNKFLCYNCVVLACCTKLCSNKLIKRS